MKITWMITENPLWVRGVIPVRQGANGANYGVNVRADQLKDVMQWLDDKTNGVNATFLGQGLIAFDTPEDKLMFMLRWSS